MECKHKKKSKIFWLFRIAWFFFFVGLLGVIAGKIETSIVARHLAELVAKEQPKTDIEKALLFNKYIHERHRDYWNELESRGESDNVHELGYRFVPYILDRGGICAQRSLLLNVALRSQGIPARKLGIGVTERTGIQHLVTEAWLNGEWRILDPTFGYAYVREDGQLATADDLAKHPDLVQKAAEADKNPHPFGYPLELYKYDHCIHFNWYRLSFVRAIGEALGEDIWHGWVPPTILNRPFYIAATASFIVCAIFVLLGQFFLWRRRKKERRAHQESTETSLSDSYSTVPMPESKN